MNDHEALPCTLSEFGNRAESIVKFLGRFLGGAEIAPELVEASWTERLSGGISALSSNNLRRGSRGSPGARFRISFILICYQFLYFELRFRDNSRFELVGVALVVKPCAFSPSAGGCRVDGIVNEGSRNCSNKSRLWRNNGVKLTSERFCDDVGAGSGKSTSPKSMRSGRETSSNPSRGFR